MVAYGGDEVSALVVDIGSSSLRAGYAGDDTPKAIIPTSYGYIKDAEDSSDVSMVDMNPDSSVAPHKKSAHMYVGQSGPSLWRTGMEVANPVVDGLIGDFEPIPSLIKHAINDVMRCDPAEHPILCTEQPWNTPANREQMAEIMFEEFDVPAFYIANTGVLTGFGAGKGSALVIDIGETMASVTPIVDGFVLRKGLCHTPLPKFVRSAARSMLTNPTQFRRGIELWPHQLIANKTFVEPGAQARFVLRQDRLPNTTKSWLEWTEAKEVDEWMQTVSGVLEHGWNDQAAAQRPQKQYEFPTGFNAFFGPERFTIGEYFYFHPQQLVANNPNLPKTIPGLVSDSLRACDPELRQVLMGNVVLTGGGSLFHGLSDRLSNELVRTFPHVKIHAAGNPIERRFGGWVGGSILGSLGTFHQLWISKEEWKEHGKAIVGQRCK